MLYIQKAEDTLKKAVTSVNIEMVGIVKRIILYGSYARDDNSLKSDFDTILLMR